MPQEARRLLDRLDIHEKPKHGSWLNMAEIELGILNSPVPQSTDPRQGHTLCRSGCLGEAP